ncbi:VolA/Pla-1 family phospholipase [Ferrimonas balearica]|uniref:VolA/Pla-1 family phospholipase n=1 Tax=Ferrimonas balearica TaxID=44012 RepID=UPI001C9A1B5E|nr:VolA/Pla-1 family phospholipase [Ferrimonas balearica]MBY5993849.1 lipase [Ferrimonas balearica]
MKRLLLSAAVTSALGLAGCSGDSYQETVENTPTPVAFSRIAFDPGAGVVPLPNDLLFSGTFDGTLVIPGEAESGDYTDPQIALGALDGWSTTQPISIEMIPGQSDISLDPGSASAPGSVRVFEVVLGGPLSPVSDCQELPSLSICQVGEELMFGEDFVTVPSGNSINVVPIKPLMPVSSYAVITTTQIMDSEGQMVMPSTTYELLKLDINTSPLVTPDQLLLQGLVNNYENSLAAAHSVDPETITYTGVFTTQSVVDSVATLSQLMVSPDPAHAPFQPGFDNLMPVYRVPGMPQFGIATVAEALGLKGGDLDGDGLPDCDPTDFTCIIADLADMYSAELTLPYYQAMPSLANGGDINGRWLALGDSPVSVLQAVQGGLLSQESFITQAVAQGIDPNEALTDPSVLVGASFVYDDGSPVDPVRHITRFNPVPAPTERVTIPVQLTIPDAARVAAFYEAQGAPWTPPVMGWPVALGLHGLGGVKETNLIVAGTYAAKGIATVAIDMPLHGARSVDLNGDGIYEISATDPSVGDLLGTDAFQNGNPLAFVNIASTLTTRDNFRQGIVDNLGLRLALTGLTMAQVEAGQMPLFDMEKVSLQGLSLGGIIGTSASAYTTLWNPELGPNPYALSNVSLVAPAGGLAGTFVGSPTFNPILMVTLVGELAPQCIDPDTGGIIDSPECAAVVEQVNSEVIPPFAFAVQTAIESMDPINHAGILGMAKDTTPVHLIEVVGNLDEGGSNPPDLVLPPTVEGFPLSGTEPLISALGLPGITQTTSDSAGRVSGAVRFRIGAHSSLISPDAATAEMQTQVADHALTQGRTITIGDGCLIKGGACPQ